MHDTDAETLVSIALCTYNGARYLPELLDSLLAQTHERIEIVASDDGSTDGTVTILNDYAERHPRMHVHTNSKNVGFKKNFEIALARCSGDYIAPCDQDDIWMPQKLEQLLREIPHTTLSYCDSELINEQGRHLGLRMSDKFSMPSGADSLAFVLGNCVSGHAMLFRRTLLDRALPIPEGFFHDWWIAAVAAANGGIAYCPQQLVLYRQHDTNVTDIFRVHSSMKLRREYGFRSKRIRETAARIAALSALPGENAPILCDLQNLWRQYESGWVSLSLAWFVFRNRERLFALQKWPRHRLWKRSASYIWGLRTKRLFHEFAYGG